MLRIIELHRALLDRILGGAATAPVGLRRAAFDNNGLDEPVATLVDKVAHHSCRATDGDVAAARVAGLNEDQIFEVVVCAAVGQATRQYAGAMAVLAGLTEGRGQR